MTNYNDGKWHVREGMKCPVHPESVVECVYTEGGPAVTQSAIYFSWRAITAFRVIKEHKEPREFWAFWSDEKMDWLISDNENHARNYHPKTHRHPVLHVREVIE